MKKFFGFVLAGYVLGFLILHVLIPNDPGLILLIAVGSGIFVMIVGALVAYFVSSTNKKNLTAMAPAPVGPARTLQNVTRLGMSLMLLGGLNLAGFLANYFFAGVSISPLSALYNLCLDAAIVACSFQIARGTKANTIRYYWAELVLVAVLAFIPSYFSSQLSTLYIIALIYVAAYIPQILKLKKS